MTIEQIVTQVLTTAIEPTGHLTFDDMGVEPKLTVSSNHIQIDLLVGFPSYFLSQDWIKNLASTITHQLPNYSCDIQCKEFISAHRTQLAGKGLRQVKNVIAVASGKGGVGKSTVAVNLAAALARAGARVGLLDADIYGPSIPLMLGKTKPVEISGEHYLPISVHGIQAMSIGYLTQGDSALIWRGPMLAKSLLQMIDITLWNNLDYLFIDLPPGTGDIQLSLVQKIPLAGAIVVTTPQNVATLDAQKAIQMFEKTGIATLGIIENMSQHLCSHCGHQEHIFGHGGAEQLAHQFECTLLGQLPLDSNIRQNADEGIPSVLADSPALTSAFMNTAFRLSVELSKRPINYGDKFPPIVAI